MEEISHALLYNNYSVDTQAVLSQHTKTLHFINLDQKNTHLDYKKKLTELQPVIHKRINALDSYPIDFKDSNKYLEKEQRRLFNVESQIKRFLKNC
jgi:hypothetical protein